MKRLEIYTGIETFVVYFTTVSGNSRVRFTLNRIWRRGSSLAIDRARCWRDVYGIFGNWPAGTGSRLAWRWQSISNIITWSSEKAMLQCICWCYSCFRIVVQHSHYKIFKFHVITIWVARLAHASTTRTAHIDSKNIRQSPYSWWFILLSFDWLKNSSSVMKHIKVFVGPMSLCQYMTWWHS